MKQWAHEFLLRLKALILKRRLDREMADELAFHQAMLKDKLVRQGVPGDEAERAAALRFGNGARWQERLWELWQFRWLENIRRDVSFSSRVLRKSPGFTAVAILTLALGVGANTTVFSIVNGLLLRPLPVPESNRLVVLGMSQGRPTPSYSFPEPLFRALESRHEALSLVFAYATFGRAQIKGSGGMETARLQLASGDYFSALETGPLMGRVLTRADDAKGGNPAGFAAVISDSFWQRWLNRAPDVIGQKLRVNNIVFTIVGVMPKQFIGAAPLERPEIFAPLAAEPAMNGDRSLTAIGTRAWWLTVMARLQPGVSVEQANAQVEAASGPALREINPDAKWIAQREREHFHLMAEPGSRGFAYIRLIFRKPLLAVFAMCGGVLLLACLNLASLLMARGAARQRELATKLSMGATRPRLVQQLLVETLLISLAGTGAGLAVAPWIGEALSVLLLGGQSETGVDTRLDIRVFSFAASISIVATLLVGLVPALQATSRGLNEQIKGQHRTQAHERQRVLGRVMMAFEVGLALMLVVGAGLLTSSLVKLYRSGVGFDPRGVENIAISMNHQPLRGAALMQFYQQVGESLTRVPGVRTVSWAWVVPLTHNTWDDSFYAPGGKEEDIHENSIGPDYFKTMRIPLFDGRDFRWDEPSSSDQKIIINRAAADLLLPGLNPIGRSIKKKEKDKVIPYEIIGVVGNAKYEDMRSPAPPTIYHPISQTAEDLSPTYNAVVRVQGASAMLTAAARSIVQRINPEIPAPTITSMSDMVDDSLSAERTMALLSVFFAICALTVAAIGLYGTLAYATARRTSEIGIRMALGARRMQVARMVFAQNSAVALAGTGGGLACALFGSKLLASFLYGTSVRDPWVFAASILLLTLIASAASMLPALRAARIEPMQAIRCE
jgi:predicted permease